MKIGYVTPQTCSLARFGEADAFVIAQAKKLFADKGLKVGGKKVTVEILIKDSQSDSKRAGDVASDLILQQVTTRTAPVTSPPRSPGSSPAVSNCWSVSPFPRLHLVNAIRHGY